MDMHDRNVASVKAHKYTHTYSVALIISPAFTNTFPFLRFHMAIKWSTPYSKLLHIVFVDFVLAGIFYFSHG